VSDFDVVEDHLSDGNQNDNHTLHRCDILDQEVGSASLVDDDQQFQVECLYSI